MKDNFSYRELLISEKDLSIKEKIDSLTLADDLYRIDFPFSVRTYNVLIKLFVLNNIILEDKQTIGAISSFSLEEIACIKGCGDVTLREIILMMIYFGYQYNYRDSRFNFSENTISLNIREYIE